MPRLSTATRWSYLVTAVLLSAGTGVSLATGEWQWFSRAGSLMVVVGILLTSSQIRDHSRRLRRLRGQLSGQSRRDWAGEERIRELVRAAGEQEAVWEIEGHGLYILVLGTLIWGFGDLVGLLLG
ncbi:MAG: hypothetical protein Kow006_00080 [Gammaproteobacteria bacterium]